jgi:hypothetical protein
MQNEDSRVKKEGIFMADRSLKKYTKNETFPKAPLSTYLARKATRYSTKNMWQKMLHFIFTSLSLKLL